MKIYTRRGDAGETALFGGQRVSKSAGRVHAYGTVDEANGHLGVAAAHLSNSALRDLIVQLQRELFDLGADLATPPLTASRERKIRRLTMDDVAALEGHIDRLEETLAPLKSFILPGGHLAAAHLHLARSVLRRAEREAVAARASGEAISEAVLAYLNRLSDLLFVMARAANAQAGIADVPWQPRDG